MKKVLSLAIAAALVAPVAAIADATVYGKIRLSGDYIDDGTDSIMEINSHASRLGIKGSEDLGNGLKGIYKLEFGVRIAGAQKPQNPNNPSITGVEEFGAVDPITARNAYVGLAGNWGTALIGRHDTPMKMSTGKLDYFIDTQADYNIAYNANFSDRRADGTIAYITPNWGGFTGAAALVPGENAEANGLADAYSLAGMYANGGLYLAAAYEAAGKDIDMLYNATLPEGALGDHAQWRLGGEYDFGTIKIGGIYENEKIDLEAGGTAADWDRWIISGAWALGKNDLKASYFTWEESESNTENTGWNLGWDYNFSKRTDLYALYTAGTIEEPNMDDDERSVISIGVNHAF